MKKVNIGNFPVMLPQVGENYICPPGTVEVSSYKIHAVYKGFFHWLFIIGPIRWEVTITYRIADPKLVQHLRGKEQ